MPTLYLETADSDVTGYDVANTSDSAGALANVFTRYADSNTISELLGSYLSPSGFPGVSGVYAKTVQAVCLAKTDILSTVFTLRFDFLRYQTTGDVGSVSESMHFDKSEGEGSKRDRVIRVSGNWASDGFTRGCRIEVAGSSECDGFYIVDDLDANVLYLSPSTPLPIAPHIYTPEEVSIDADWIEYLGDSATVTTKEELLVRGTPSEEFSAAEQEITVPAVSFSDTFAADDRLVVRAWAQKTDGQSSAWVAFQTEGADPCVVDIT
jgi:hypothetical protein